MIENGALRDVRILDLTRVLSGPLAAMWLGDLGADVIKIEMPGKGDDARLTPIHVNGYSTFFAAMNRNKRSVTLNLKAEEGRNILLEMAKQADVVLSNYRPGVMEKLGLGYEDFRKVNERIIFATVSGFGQNSKYASRPAYDIVGQGMGGIMALNGPEGSDPTRVGTSIADVTAGMNTVIGILAALHARTLTGKGQCVDISLVDSVLALMPSENVRYFVGGQLVPRLGNRYAGNAPYGSFKAKDKYFNLACGSDKLFRKFAVEILKQPELAEDERFSIMAKRAENYPLVKAFVEEWASAYTVDEIVELCLSHGIPAGPIWNMDDISKDSYFTEDRDMLISLDQPGVGRITVTNSPVKLSDTKTAVRRPAPALGEHNVEVYGELLGYDEEKLAELKKNAII
jgi:formyl-CoA transferase